MATIAKRKSRTKSKTRSDDAFARDRKRRDKRRSARDLKMHPAHFWDVCPKCGADMFEQTVGDIKFEVCRRCHGIYIDAQEVALAIEHRDASRWLRSLLRRARKPRIP